MSPRCVYPLNTPGNSIHAQRQLQITYQCVCRKLIDDLIQYENNALLFLFTCGELSKCTKLLIHIFWEMDNCPSMVCEKTILQGMCAGSPQHSGPWSATDRYTGIYVHWSHPSQWRRRPICHWHKKGMFTLVSSGCSQTTKSSVTAWSHFHFSFSPLSTLVLVRCYSTACKYHSIATHILNAPSTCNQINVL